MKIKILMNLSERYAYADIKSYFGTEVAEKCRLRNDLPFAKINFVFGSDLTLNNGFKTAAVISLALLSNKQQRVKYQLKWDSPASAPEGNHLNQQDETLAGTFVEDKDPNGDIITDKEGYLFDDDAFCFYDEIVQSKLTGKWTFRILVLDAKENILAEDSVDIDWDSHNFK